MDTCTVSTLTNVLPCACVLLASVVELMVTVGSAAAVVAAACTERVAMVVARWTARAQTRREARMMEGAESLEECEHHLLHVLSAEQRQRAKIFAAEKIQ